MWSMQSVWFGDRSSSHQNAAKLESWLQEFASVEDAVEPWCTATSPTDRYPIRNWEEMLDKSRASSSVGMSHIGAWAPFGYDDGYKLTFFCGITDPKFFNQLVLQVPEVRFGLMLDIAVVRRLLSAAARLWDVKFGRVSDSTRATSVRRVNNFAPGWITLLPNGSPHVAEMDALGWRSEDIDGIGRLYVATENYEDSVEVILRDWGTAS